MVSIIAPFVNSNTEARKLIGRAQAYPAGERQRSKYTATCPHASYHPAPAVHKHPAASLGRHMSQPYLLSLRTALVLGGEGGLCSREDQRQEEKSDRQMLRA